MTNGLMKKSEGKSKKYLETNENENTAYQNLSDAAKAVLREKFIVINTYIKKERPQINNLTLHLKKLDKEQTKLKVSRRKEIAKVRAEMK